MQESNSFVHHLKQITFASDPEEKRPRGRVPTKNCRHETGSRVTPVPALAPRQRRSLLVLAVALRTAQAEDPEPGLRVLLLALLQAFGGRRALGEAAAVGVGAAVVAGAL
jgi:hypothetical protein